ncbi:MAG: MEDS domain-containing protein, partial [Burkholderiales bacterium]
MILARSAAQERKDDTYCTVSQAAALLGVSRVSIWRWIRDGHLPAIRMGQRITRIRQKDLEHVRVQSQSTGSPSWLAQQNQAAHANSPSGLEQQTAAAPRPASDHAVQFYETDAFLLDAVTRFIGEALRAGDVGIVVATKPHRDSLARRLRVARLDLDDVVGHGRFISLDATEMLSRFIVKGMPDAERFAAEIGSVVARAARTGRRVHLFGEMVSLLVAEENYAAAVRLEALWNEIQRREDFSLLCAYPIGQLGAQALTDVLGDICAAHAHVIPAESFTALPTEHERARAVVALQQQARWLQSQV